MARVTLDIDLSELDEKYFNIAKKRIGEQCEHQPKSSEKD